jgi:hypothetical protein
MALDRDRLVRLWVLCHQGRRGRRFRACAEAGDHRVGWSGPGVPRAGRVQAGPPTTADCGKAYKVACYQPARIRQAYDLPSVDARYFVSELALAVGDGKVILSRTGLGASLGNGVII